MIDEGKECEAVLMQLSAVRAALDRVGTSHQSSYERMSAEYGRNRRQEAMEAAFEVFFEVYVAGAMTQGRPQGTALV